MGNSPVDRNREYMRKMWGTQSLITDYWSLPRTGQKDIEDIEERVIQEFYGDNAPKHNFKRQTELHEKIRNDNDYDDWEYGTEPTYGT